MPQKSEGSANTLLEEGLGRSHDNDWYMQRAGAEQRAGIKPDLSSRYATKVRSRYENTEYGPARVRPRAKKRSRRRK